LPDGCSAGFNAAGYPLLGVGVTVVADFVVDDLFGTPEPDETVKETEATAGEAAPNRLRLSSAMMRPTGLDATGETPSPLLFPDGQERSRLGYAFTLWSLAQL
jgi:hypothetical protein